MIVIFHIQEKSVLNSIPTIINPTFDSKGYGIFNETRKGYD
jgi:hypothetical protein